MRLFKVMSVISCFVLSAPMVLAAGNTYTSGRFLYSVDYPEHWRLKEISNITTFLSPLESKEDKFAENVSVVVEDLSPIDPPVSLLDYHRKSVANAPASLPDFKMLEEAKTKFAGREAIAVLYTATLRGQPFRFKAYTLMVGKEAYVLTYTALRPDFDKYLSAAEKIMGSLRASP